MGAAFLRAGFLFTTVASRSRELVQNMCMLRPARHMHWHAGTTVNIDSWTEVGTERATDRISTPE